MSRIQNILDKAERDGASLRTTRVGVPAAVPAIPVTSNHAGATVPITIDIPTPPAPMPEPVLVRDIVPGAPSAQTTSPATSVPASDAIQSYTVRLNPVLVAGLAPKSLAAEQYRQLRTRLSHAEGASTLRTVLITSPQKGEGKSVTAANLALTMAQELQRRVILVEADLRKPSLQNLFGLPPGPGLRLGSFRAGPSACSGRLPVRPRIRRARGDRRQARRLDARLGMPLARAGRGAPARPDA